MSQGFFFFFLSFFLLLLFVVLFELFVLPFCSLHTCVWSSVSTHTHTKKEEKKKKSMLSRIFQSLAGVVPSMPALWRVKVKVLCSKRCGLTPLNPPPPSPSTPTRPFPPLLFSPSGQTVFMLLDEWKKERGNFYLLRRFSPRQNSKLNSICLDLKKQQMKKKKKKRR